MDAIITDPIDNPYRRLFRFPKWNGTVRATQEPKILRRLPEFTRWTRDRHVTEARTLLQIARNYWRLYLNTLDAAIQAYGDGNGQLISGIHRDHYPEEVKRLLRTYAHLTSEYNDRSHAHWRVAGKHLDTWRAEYGAMFGR